MECPAIFGSLSTKPPAGSKSLKLGCSQKLQLLLAKNPRAKLKEMSPKEMVTAFADAHIASCNDGLVTRLADAQGASLTGASRQQRTFSCVAAEMCAA
jgi:hypothetical protein